MPKSLFCLPNAALSGGNKVLLDWAAQAAEQGDEAQVFVWKKDKRNLSDWYTGKIAILPHADMPAALAGNFDVVYFARAFLIPLALPHLGSARPVYVCQDYEGFYVGNSPAEMRQQSQAFDDVLRLPIQIICTSTPVGKKITAQTGQNSHFVPLAIDDKLFEPLPLSDNFPRGGRIRVLLVGDHLLPIKGIKDALDALALLSDAHPIEAVLVTRQTGGQQIAQQYDFPIEFHIRPSPGGLKEIYHSCDIFCCPSWYEGFGLPALEAMQVGLPVVSTKNSGVENYGEHGTNILLAEPNNPTELAAQLARLIGETTLRAALIENGRKTLQHFTQLRSQEQFTRAQKNILSDEGEFRQNEKPTAALLQEMLTRLEEEGLYTPMSTHIGCSTMFEELDTVIAAMLNGQMQPTQFKERLAGIAAGLTPHLQYPGAEYYRTCKKKYDLCKLLGGIADDARLKDVLPLMAGPQART